MYSILYIGDKDSEPKILGVWNDINDMIKILIKKINFSSINDNVFINNKYELFENKKKFNTKINELFKSNREVNIKNFFDVYVLYSINTHYYSHLYLGLKIDKKNKFESAIIYANYDSKKT